MSLSASLYAGITGLSAHGERMNVLGNNIANVSTIGFKATRMHFEDAISQDISTSQGSGQVGRGVMVSAILSDFSQGAFENTNEATDLAIGGEGFFTVKVKNEESKFYTRAGNFRFDSDGYLVDPHGYVLQGWEVDDTRVSALAEKESQAATASTRIRGVPTDIRLDNFQSAPSETTSINLVANLDSNEYSRSNSGTGDPFFAMMQNWDGTKEDPIGDTQYAYSTTMAIYDENGTSHDLTVYFDPVTTSNSGGRRVWEYMVTVPPTEDGRFLSGAGGDTFLRNTSAAGLLAVGTLTFNPAGELENVSHFALEENSLGDGNLKGLSNWKVPDTFSQNGRPLLVANFLSVEDASFVDSSKADTEDVYMELDFGMSNATKTWKNSVNSNAGVFNGLPASGGTIDNIPGFTDPVRSALATTSYSAGSTTLFQSQDGYSAGFLQNISVDRDGVVVGRYSNGEVIELYVVTLAGFNNETGLTRAGGNLFGETRESGPAITNRPNTAGLGSIASNSLEQSNVDMATEFVKMITTQRGFQANSKVITSTDTMLGELIQLKR